MGRPKREPKPLPPIWRTPDELWAEVERILAEHDPPARFGPAWVDRRPVLDAVIFRLRSGCQWNHLPEELPDDSTVHRTFQRWVRLGVLKAIWATVLAACEELGGVDWEWQAADGWLGKARKGGTWSVPTPPIARRTA